MQLSNPTPTLHYALILLPLVLIGTRHSIVSGARIVDARCASNPCVTLNNGVLMPQLSFGTWQLSDDEITQLIPLALSIGVTHIDSSVFYFPFGADMSGMPNQPALGRALAGFARESYFITTKIDPSFDGSTAYAAATAPFTEANAYYRTLEQAARNLGDLAPLESVDLMLVHWSSPTCAVMQEIWRAMETVHRLGWARAVGVSNYCPRTLSCILQTAKVVPAVNQVKLHVGMGPDPGGVKSFCAAHGITLQAYSPLGAGGKAHTSELISGELVSRIAAKHPPVSGAQVALRWLVQHGVPFSTKSTSEAHLRDSMAILSNKTITLDAADVAALDTHVTHPTETYSFTCDCKAAGTCGPQAKIGELDSQFW